MKDFCLSLRSMKHTILYSFRICRLLKRLVTFYMFICSHVHLLLFICSCHKKWNIKHTVLMFLILVISFCICRLVISGEKNMSNELSGEAHDKSVLLQLKLTVNSILCHNWITHPTAKPVKFWVNTWKDSSRNCILWDENNPDWTCLHYLGSCP